MPRRFSIGRWTGRIGCEAVRCMAPEIVTRTFATQRGGAITKTKGTPRSHGGTEKSKRKMGFIAGQRAKAPSGKRRVDFFGLRSLRRRRTRNKTAAIFGSDKATRRPYSVFSVASVGAVSKYQPPFALRKPMHVAPRHPTFLLLFSVPPWCAFGPAPLCCKGFRDNSNATAHRYP